MQALIALAENGLVPTPVLRAGIRHVVGRRLDQERRRTRSMEEWIRQMTASPVALDTPAANEQHYEVPPAFFEQVLGPHLKYSAAYWPEGVTALVEAEQAMLDLTIERAALADGQLILDLGCGWGSLSLEIARRYRKSAVLAVSNSARQRAFIEARARERGLTNLIVRTADMNEFAAPTRVDRVVSVEMFEHMRNWPELLRRVHGWLAPDGALFVHVFAHVRYAYPYESEGSDDWMARHFFTGGMMPSDDLLPRVATDFEVEGHWTLDGTHYGRTADAWYVNLMVRRLAVQPILEAELGRKAARVTFHRWRLFLLACAELFNYGGGREWVVSHYLLRPRVDRRAA
jgi:cyclopropane-fatty-acyl-phospholipid synthase